MTDAPLKILLMAAEMVPFAKTGGLADVAGALPKAIKAYGHDIRVAMPRYGRIDRDRFQISEALAAYPVPMDDRAEEATLMQAKLVTAGDEIPVYMVDNTHYYDRDGIYMYEDDADRFIFFCRATLEGIKRLGWQPDVIHCHDWHTAIVPNWLRTVYRDDPFFADTASVYTIHNLAYQGIFDYRFLELAGVAHYGFLYPQISELQHVVDLMGRGILFADAVTTVSERYAEEVLTPEYGERLDPLLRERQDRLFGILNGIDEDELDPRTDPYIAAHFDVQHLAPRLKNKVALQQEAGLPVSPEIPVIGMIGRLSSQKGLDLLVPVVDALLHQPMQLVVLGTGDQHYQDLLQWVRAAHPERAAAFLTFNTPLAQRIYAGSDAFLMPSRYEPCGLGQMIAMRYGSVPIVRATGGLATTVQDWDPRAATGNGFSFSRYDAMALFATVIRALETYKYPDAWRTLQRRGMEGNFSWRRSAAKYVQVYEVALRSKERGVAVPGNG